MVQPETAPPPLPKAVTFSPEATASPPGGGSSRRIRHLKSLEKKAFSRAPSRQQQASSSASSRGSSHGTTGDGTSSGKIKRRSNAASSTRTGPREGRSPSRAGRTTTLSSRGRSSSSGSSGGGAGRAGKRPATSRSTQDALFSATLTNPHIPMVQQSSLGRPATSSGGVPGRGVARRSAAVDTPPTRSRSSNNNNTRSSPPPSRGASRRATARSAFTDRPLDAAAISSKIQNHIEQTRPHTATMQLQPTHAYEVPRRPFPEHIIFAPFSYTPRRHLDLSDWVVHLAQEESLARLVEQNTTFEGLTIRNSPVLDDYLVRCIVKAIEASRSSGRAAGSAGTTTPTRQRFAPIKHVDLSECDRLTDVAVKLICGFFGSSLARLHLSHCTGLTDYALRSVGQAGAQGRGALVDLALGGCSKFSDLALVNMAGQCTSVTKLDVSGCVHVSDSTLAAFGKHMSGLRAINFSGCAHASDAGLHGLLVENTTMERIEAQRCPKVTGEGLSAIFETRVLWGTQLRPASALVTTLELSDAPGVPNTVFKSILTSCSGIKKLVLNRCRGLNGEPNATMGCIMRMSKLEHLGVSECPFVTNGALVFACNTGRHRALTHLDISRCGALTDEGMKALAKTFRELRGLLMSELPGVTEDAFNVMGKYLSKLRNFDMHGTPQATDRAMGVVGKRLRNLTSLNVSMCQQLTQRCLRDISTMRNVRTLDLSACPLISDNALRALPKDRLENLNLSYLERLTDKGMAQLMRLPNLKTLDVSHCANITHAGVRDVVFAGDLVHSIELVRVENCVKVRPQAILDIAKEHPGLDAKHRDGVLLALEADVATRQRRNRFRTYLDRVMVKASAVRIQRTRRRLLAEEEAEHAQEKLRARMALSVVAMQVGARAFLARKRVQRRKQNLMRLAVALQVAFRLGKERDLLRKAIAQYRRTLPRKVFRHWRDHTRRMMWLLFSPLPEEDARARTHCAFALQRQVWRAWELDFRSTGNVAALKLRARRHWERKTRPRLFFRWAAKASVSLARRRRVAAVFQQTVALEAWNSTRGALNVSVALEYHRMALTSWIWVYIREYCAAITKTRHQNEAARRFARQMLLRGAVQLCFGALGEYVAAQRVKRAALRRSDRHLHRRWRDQGLNKLHNYAQAMKSFKEQTKAALLLWRNGILSYCYRCWRLYLDHRRKRHRDDAAAAADDLRRLKNLGVGRWVRNVKNAIAERERMAKMLKVARRFYGGQILTVCFTGWKLILASAEEAKRMADAKMNRALVKNTFATWRGWYRQEVMARKKLEEEMAQLGGSATEIQRIARGFLGRIHAREWRVYRDFAIIKVQAQFRMRKAMKLGARLRRYRNLKSYLVEEVEMDLMKAEDDRLQGIRRIHRAATVIQSWMRGVLAIWRVTEVRFDMVRGKGNKWMLDQQRAMEEAERRALRRKELLLVHTARATDIQRLYRGHRGRRRYRFMLQYHLETQAAILCQRVFRGRRGRRINEARRRHLAVTKHTIRSRRFQGRIMRLFGYRNRTKQRKLLNKLAGWGVDPISFITEWKIELEQLGTDMAQVYSDVTRELEAYMKYPKNRHLRDQLRHEHRERHRAPHDVRPTDAVKIIANGQKHTGLTAYVLSLDLTNQANPVAELSMDQDGTMAYYPTITEATATSSSQICMHRISRLKKKPPRLLQPTGRKQLLKWGEGELPKWEVYLAARTIQMLARRWLAQRRAARQRFRYWKAIKSKRYLFLSTLTCIGVRWQQSADTMMRYRVARELMKENFADLPRSLRLPMRLEEQITLRRHRRLLQAEFRNRIRERRKFVSHMRHHNRAPDYMHRPLRVMKSMNVAISRDVVNFYKHTFWPVADLICNNKNNTKAISYKVARLIGGRAWTRNDDELSTWAKNFQFAQFHGSPHVRVHKSQFYHGVWRMNKPLQKLIPHGEGLVEFLAGYGVAKEEKQLQVVVLSGRNLKPMDNNGSSDPYVKIELNRKVLKTRYIAKDLNPQWDEVFEIDVTDPDAVLQLSVWDHDTFSRDDYIGGANIRLRDIDVGSPVRRWYKLLLYSQSWFTKGTGSNKGEGSANAELGEIEVQLNWTLIPQADDVEVVRARARAALELQCWGRVVIAKQRRDDLIKKNAADLQAIEEMALKIECAARCRQARLVVRWKRRAKKKAIRIQCFARQWLARRVVFDIQLRAAVAVKLQSVVRRRLAQVCVWQIRFRRIVERMFAAVAIQSMVRQRFAREDVRFQREECKKAGTYIKCDPSDMSWYGKYGVDPDFGSIRLRRMCYRCFAQMLNTPGAVVVTPFGNADIVQYPAKPLEGLDAETGDLLDLREGNDAIALNVHGFCDMRLPAAERKDVIKRASKFPATMRLGSISVSKTLNRFATFIQCLVRQRLAYARYTVKKQIFDSATVIQKFWHRIYINRVWAATKVQCMYRKDQAVLVLMFKRLEVSMVTRVQCAYRVFRARRLLEDCRDVASIQVVGTSSDLSPTFSGDRALQFNDALSFWCSAVDHVRDQWINFDMGRPVAIGIIRIRSQNDTSAPRLCRVETANDAFGDFEPLHSFELRLTENVQSIYIADRRIARLWRLVVLRNHGSKEYITVVGARFLLAPEESVEVEQNPATVFREVGPLVGHRGDDIVLSCRASGWPRPLYQWKLNGVALPGETAPDIKLRVQIEKAKSTKKYRCTHCRKVKVDLAKNIFKCVCRNCGYKFAFPEQIEAEASRSYLTDQERTLKDVLRRLHVIEGGVKEDIENVLHKMETEGVEPEKANGAPPVSIADLAQARRRKDLTWEEKLMEKVTAVPDFVEEAFSTIHRPKSKKKKKKIQEKAKKGGEGQKGTKGKQGAEEEDTEPQPREVLDELMAEFDQGRERIDKRTLVKLEKGLRLQERLVRELRFRTQRALEVLVYERLQQAKDDLVKLHYDIEGIFTCEVRNVRGASVEGEGGVWIKRESKPCAVYVGDPAYLPTKVTTDYNPKKREKRKNWPKYTSIHGWTTWGQVCGDVIVRFDSGDVYAGPYVEERWIDSMGYTHPRGRESDHWGTWITPDNHIYEGLAVDNHFDVDHINGNYRVTYPTSEVYEGEYTDNHRHGVGEFYYNNECVYEGEWYLNKRQGFGALRSPDGTVYEGEWDHDTIHGEGIWNWPDGSSYMGTTNNGRRTGKGMYITKDGSIYHGDFKNNQMDGEGVFTYNDGSRYEGQFVDNQRCGRGMYIDFNGVKYIGTFRDDRRHGEIVVRRPVAMPHVKGDMVEDEVQVGLWEDGEFIEWLTDAMNPLATLQFYDLFENSPEEYDGVYAMLIARRLPKLPSGIEPDHPRVIPIVERITREGGELVARDTHKETLANIKSYEPVLDDAIRTNQEQQRVYDHQMKLLTHATNSFETAKAKHLHYAKLVQNLKAEIENFWEVDEAQTRLKYEQATVQLCKLTARDCFEIRHFNDPPPVLERVMAAACMMMQQGSDWKTGQLLLSTSLQNHDEGDEEAAYYDYEVKMVWLTERFDVWARAMDDAMIGTVGGILTDPRLKPDHYTVASYGTTLVYIVEWLWAAMAYVRKAKTAVKRKQELDQMENLQEAMHKQAQRAEEEMRHEQQVLDEIQVVLTETTRARDQKLRHMNKLRELLARCESMVTTYVPEDDHELDYYELQERQMDKADRTKIEYVMEEMMQSIEKNVAPYEDIDEDPLPEIIDTQVAKYHDTLFQDGAYGFDHGELVVLSEDKATPQMDLIDSLMAHIVLRINAVLNEEDPDQPTWYMLNGNVWTADHIQAVVHHKWNARTEGHGRALAAAAWDEAFPNGSDAAENAVKAKYNYRIAPEPQREATKWCEVHPEEARQAEEKIASEFAAKFPKKPSKRAFRVVNEAEPNLEEYIGAKVYLWVHPDEHRKARDAAEKEKATEFAKAYEADELAKKAAEFTLLPNDDASSKDPMHINALAWASRHMGEVNEALAIVGEAYAEQFEARFKDGTAGRAVRALRTANVPHEIRIKAAAWSSQHRKAYKLAENKYLAEQETEDHSRAESIAQIKKRVKGQPQSEETRFKFEEHYNMLWKALVGRAEFNRAKLDQTKANLEAVESDASYRVVSSRWRPSEARKELQDRRQQRASQLKDLHEEVDRLTKLLDDLDQDQRHFFPDKFIVPAEEEQGEQGWEGWVEMYDQSSGAYYYLNEETGETAWAEG